MKLTEKQEKVLTAIQKLTLKSGYSPTLNEIKEFLQYNSTSAVQRHTEALKKKGYLSSNKYQSRGLRLTKSNCKKHNIPLVGEVACGQPFLAVENIEAYIPREIKGNPEDYFFLRAVGDSMNKANIDDGDLVLVKKQSSVSSGEKVVALIGDEATIKIFKKEENHIVLEPKSNNPKNKPIYIFEDIQIQGKVIDVIKQ